MFCKFIWHNLTIVTCQWYVLSYGSNNCVFSCYLVDGLRVVAKQQSCSIVFLIRRTPTVLIYWELQLFFCTSNSKLFLSRRTQIVLVYVEPNVFLVASNLKCSTQDLKCSTQDLKCSTQLCSKISQLRQRPFVFADLHHEKSRSVALSSKHTPWRVPLFCTLHSAQERYCILNQESTVTLHYSVDSGLCITLQLWNTVAHVNPVIMHRLTFKKE